MERMRKALSLLLVALVASAFLRADDEWVGDDSIISGGKTLIRFPPGVTRHPGGGWYDVTKLGFLNLPSGERINDGDFCWAFGVVNMAAWWLDHYRSLGLPANAPPEGDRPYAHGETPSRYGYPTPLADAVIEKWKPTTGHARRMFDWLLAGKYDNNWSGAALRDPDNVGGAFLRHVVPESVAPDILAYVGAEEHDFTLWGNTKEDVKAYFSERLLDLLARGPMAFSIGSHVMTLWGAEFKRGLYKDGSRLLVSRLYIADNDRWESESSAQRLDPYGVTFTNPVGSSYVKPHLEKYKAAAPIQRVFPLFAYGKETPGVTPPDPEPEPEPDPDPDPEPEPEPNPDPDPKPEPAPGEPPLDPEVPDDNLGGRYPYTVSRSFWKARKLAIAQGKALFIVSGADWCSYCSRVKDYLATVPGFANDFVVYYASREGVGLSPYFHGGLPEFGAFDPRKANPFAGTLTTEGGRVWSNAWEHPDNGAWAHQRGYSVSGIEACVQAARAQWRPELAEPTGFALVGSGTVVAGAPTPYAFQARFPDGVAMALDHRVTWQVMSGPATVTPEGVLTANGLGEIRLRATAWQEFAGATAELTVTAIDARRIVGLSLAGAPINLEDTPRPQVPCAVRLDDGTELPMPPERWEVRIVPGSQRPLPGFDIGFTLMPEVSAEGILSYKMEGSPTKTSISICDHELEITAWRGAHSATRIIKVFGPTQVAPKAVELLSPRQVAPGSVVRLKVPALEYTYGGNILETANTLMADYVTQLTLPDETSAVFGRATDCQVAVPLYVAHPSRKALPVKLFTRKAGGSYESTTHREEQTLWVDCLPPGEPVRAGAYANVTTGWLQANFPGRPATAVLAEEDSDGDGFPNWQEFLLGTEPANVADAFAYTSQHFAANVADAAINLYYKVMFTIRPGREYTFWAKERWGDAWQKVGFLDASTRTAPTELNATLADRAKFFRVEVGFSTAEGNKPHCAQTFIPDGMALAPGAEIDLSDGSTLSWATFALDDYAPGDIWLRLPETVRPGTALLTVPDTAKHRLWLPCFKVRAPEGKGLEIRETADGRLALVAVDNAPAPQDGVAIVVPELGETPLVIARAWLDRHAAWLREQGLSAEDFTDAARLTAFFNATKAANGRPLWAFYLIGLDDPADPKTDLRLEIAFDAAGLPVLSWTPDRRTEPHSPVTYTLFGKTSFAEDWAPADPKRHRFFKLRLSPAPSPLHHP